MTPSLAVRRSSSDEATSLAGDDVDAAWSGLGGRNAGAPARAPAARAPAASLRKRRRERRVVITPPHEWKCLWPAPPRAMEQAARVSALRPQVKALLTS